MDINITLLGQLITFAIFVWFTMRFVWPPILEVIKKREDQIAEGLRRAEQGVQALEDAQVQANELFTQAKDDAAKLLDQANQRADNLINEAKHDAEKRAKGIVDGAKQEIAQMVLSAQEQLQSEVVSLSMAMTEKLIAGLDEKQQKVLLDKALEGGS